MAAAPIGLDASVVVRLLVGLPQGQAAIARRRLERAFEDDQPILVCDLVLAETYYALCHHYRVPKDEARRLLRDFAASGLVTVEPPEVAGALAPARGAGLVDRLIHARYRRVGAVVVTFERKQAALGGAERLPGR